MRHYMQLEEVRATAVTEPLLISWYDQGTRYGVCHRMASMRRDVVKLLVIEPYTKIEFELLLMAKPHEVRPILVNDKGTDYQITIPVTVQEEQSCYKVLGMAIPKGLVEA